MGLKKPLALYSGKMKELRPEDKIDIEVDLIRLINKDASVLPKLSLVRPSSTALSIVAAVADSYANGYAMGFLTEETAVDAYGAVQADGFISGTDAEWQAVTEDSASLVPGTVYYLSKAAPGKITAVPPASAPGTVQIVGRALSTEVFDITIGEPTELS